MNLLQTIRAIEEAAAGQPAVGTIVRNDVFRLNARNDVRYGVFAWLQNEHTTQAESGLIDYSFTFFYVDRLTAGKGNEVEVQSVGIDVLTNVIRELEDAGLYGNGTISFRTFNQRFSDECAGVFCNVVLETAKDSLCSTDYGTATPDYDESDNRWTWVLGDKTIYII